MCHMPVALWEHKAISRAGKAATAGAPEQLFIHPSLLATLIEDDEIPICNSNSLLFPEQAAQELQEYYFANLTINTPVLHEILKNTLIPAHRTQTHSW